jgi:putative tryptophan/tyrosine transport system substrate-binding protein
MIGRRAILLAPAIALGASALRAQSAAQPRRIGVLRPGARPPEDDVQIAGLTAALRTLGHVVGRSIVIEHRFAEGQLERLPMLARDLLNQGAEVIVAVGSSAALAMREATPSIPIIMFANVDPVALGIVDRLGRPLGNVTGVLIAPNGTLAAKRLWLLREAVPQATRFALLAPEADPSFALQVRETSDAAVAAGLALTVVNDHRGDYRKSFDEMVAAGAQGLVVGAHQFFVRDRRAIIDLAGSHRLPAIYEWAEQVRDGGLMSYGASLNERYQRVAIYIDRLLKGAKASDLPFEQPAALQTVLNLKTAGAMGLRIPDSLIARADEVIE